MPELETVMQRLDTQARRLKDQASTGDSAERAMMAESLALVSEALLKVGRDIRYIRNQMTEKH